MNLIDFLLRSSWRMVAIAIAAGFCSGGCSAGAIAVVSVAVSTPSPPLYLAWSFAGLALVALLSSIVTRAVLIRLSQSAVFQLQMRLSRQVLSSELRQLERLGSSRILATLTEDVQAISNAVYVLPFLCINLAIVAGCLVYITWLSWQVLVIVLGLSSIATISCRFLLRSGWKWLYLARNEQDLLFKHFRTIADGIKELKLNYQRRQDFVVEELQVTASQFRGHNVRGLTLFAATDSWGKSIFFFAIACVLFLLPNWMAIAPQTLSGYVLTFTYLIGPMESIVNKLPLFAKANIALHKIEALGLSLVTRAEMEIVPPPIDYSWKCLELKGVTHCYQGFQEDVNFTLGPIDLMLQPGEILFIIGGNGSGKSTLAKLITGLYIPEAGEIWLDKRAIGRPNREWYRQHFSVVFSDFYLFDKLLDSDNYNLEREAENYLHKLQLDRKVKLEKGKLSTTDLSQGQRKRLALLAAYLEDRPLYLFDEWAADQDPTFKELFYTQFLPQLKARGKAILVISHDDRYFHLADRIVKLDYGKVVSLS